MEGGKTYSVSNSVFIIDESKYDHKILIVIVTHFYYNRIYITAVPCWQHDVPTRYLYALNATY